MTQALVLKPDLVLMDISMPVMNGLAAARLIKAQQPEMKIVILATSAEGDDLFEAIKSGACGYLLKTTRGPAFIEAIHGLEQGVPAFSPGLAELLLREFARLGGKQGDSEAKRSTDTGKAKLTERQTEVLRLVAAGLTYKQAEEKLCLSDATVRYHMIEIMHLLHLENRNQVIAYAGSVGEAYSQAITITGGTPPYGVTNIYGSLPEGLSFDEATFTLSGTPTTVGTGVLNLVVQDADGISTGWSSLFYIQTEGSFTLTSDPSPSAPGQSVTFTLTGSGDVVIPGYGAIPPTGAVAFYDGEIAIEGCSDVLLNYDSPAGLKEIPAVCTTSALSAGPHEIRAEFTGFKGYFYKDAIVTLSQQVGLPDTTPPAITPDIAGAPGANGWYVGNISLNWEVADPESGLTSQSGCDPVAITNDQEAKDYTCTATTAGGTNSVKVTIGRDATSPAVVVAGVEDGSSYYFGSIPQSACTTTDAPSGVATNAALTLTGGDEKGLGSFTATCSGAVDQAGHAASLVSAYFTVLPVADLSITKTGNKGTVKPGAGLVYTLVVRNNGPHPALNLSVVDTLDGDTKYISTDAPDGWKCDYVLGKVTCTGTRLAAGSSATIRIIVTVNKSTKIGKELVNNAVISSATYDLEMANNTVVQKTLVSK